MPDSIANTQAVTIHVDQLGQLDWKFTGSVDPEGLLQEKHKRIKELRQSGKLRIKGFRPKNVTPQIIERFYGSDIEKEVLEKMVYDAVEKTFKERALTPVSTPKVEWLDDEDAPHQSFSLTFESYPQNIELQAFEDIQVEKLAVDITDLDIERVLDQRLDYHAELEPVDVPSESGHYVLLDFIGKINGESFPGGEVENFKLKLGSQTMIPGFEDQLIGLKAGEDKTFKLTFPDPYPVQEICGKEVDFNVKIRQVNTSKHPQLTEEFLKASFGIEDGQVSTLRKNIKTELSAQADQLVKSHLSSTVLDKLFEKYQDIPLPRSLLSEEINRIHVSQEEHRNTPIKTMTVDDLADIDLKTTQDPTIRRATRNLVIFMILQKVAEANEMELDQERLKRRLYTMLGGMSESTQQVKNILQNEQYMHKLRLNVFEEQIIDHIVRQVQTTEKKTTYQELTEKAFNST